MSPSSHAYTCSEDAAVLGNMMQSCADDTVGTLRCAEEFVPGLIEFQEDVSCASDVSYLKSALDVYNRRTGGNSTATFTCFGTGKCF